MTDAPAPAPAEGDGEDVVIGRDGGPVPPSGPDLTWSAVRQAERALVEGRWTWLASTSWFRGGRPSHEVGLALSGGGIRSATFSMGVLRSLSRSGLLARIDYLSTVSGGGYAGTFLRSLFVPGSMRGTNAEIDAKTAERCVRRANDLGPDPLGSNIGRAAVEQLRQGGSFLSPNGASDNLYAALVALRNWLAVALVTGSAILAVFLFLQVPRAATGVGIVRNVHAALTGAVSVTAGEPDEAAKPCSIDLRNAEGSFTLRCYGRAAAAGVAGSLPHKGIAPDPGPMLGSSWLWLVAAAILPLWTAPVAWAYWLTWNGSGIPRRRAARLLSGTAGVSLTIVLVGIAAVAADDERGALSMVGAFAAASALGAPVAYAIALWRNHREEGPIRGGPGQDAAALAQENRVRTKLSRWLLRGTQVLLLLSGVALADDLGRAAYHYANGAIGRGSVGLGTALFGGGWLLVVPIARWVLKRAGSARLPDWPKVFAFARRFGKMLALVLGIFLLGALAAAWSAVSYWLVWQGDTVPAGGSATIWGTQDGWQMSAGMFVLASVVAVALGRFHGFLNQSSLAFFYAGRLRKAYLGASNVERSAARTAPDVELSTDEIELGAYHHPAVLGPVHLVNVTINETTSRSSRVVQLDRRGKSLCVSPAGYVFTRRGPSEEAVAFSLRYGEQLPMSTWMGISGAAFSTGMGQAGSAGLSMLAGLCNLRLGYWWDSPYPGRVGEQRAPSQAGTGRQMPGAVSGFFDDLVQSYLVREVRGAFEGTHSNRWYLTDGGHYENTGVYELVRRRVRFIVACDNGADPGYAFADLVNLIRKLRIDFDAEVEFLTSTELDGLMGKTGSVRAAFGGLEELGARPADGVHRAGPYAALARIRYLGAEDQASGTRPGTLLLIKPRIAGSETPDVLRYHDANVEFPQQPTTDQFFDEAQWESYFRLGQVLGDAIFASGDARPRWPAWLPWSRPAPVWHPAALEPLP